MMPRWKAAMPKDRAPEGMSHFLFAFKTSSGERVEFSGKALTKDMISMLRDLQGAIIEMKNKSSSETGAPSTDSGSNT